MNRGLIGMGLAAAFLLGAAGSWWNGAPGRRAERAAAGQARQAATADGWRAYLAAYPAGSHAGEAQAWLAALGRPAPVPPAPPPPSAVARLRLEMHELEQRFAERSAARAQAVASAASGSASTPAGVAAGRPPIAPLPPAPTAAEVDAYLLALQQRLVDAHRFDPADPDIALIRVVPAAHLNLLLEAARTSTRGVFGFLVLEALPDVVTPDQRPVIISALPDLPGLIKVVERNHWQEAALPTLRAHVRTIRDGESQVRWVRAIVAAGNPDDFPLLQETILAHTSAHQRRDLCREVQAVGRFPLAETVARCWATRRTMEGTSAFLPLAAEYGQREALARIVACVTEREPFLSSDAAGEWLTGRTDAPDEPQRLLLWLGTPEDPPAYDAATRRWRREMPAAPGF